MRYNDSAISVPFPEETRTRRKSISSRENYIKEQNIPEEYVDKVLEYDIVSSLALANEKASVTYTIRWFLKRGAPLKEDVLTRISKIIDRLVEDNEVFRGIDKTKLLNVISEMLDEFTPEQMQIPEDELLERIKGVLALEAMSGILNDLTPEQLEVFEEAVKRRPLFK